MNKWEGIKEIKWKHFSPVIRAQQKQLVGEENAQRRDPRLEQEPADMLAMHSDDQTSRLPLWDSAATPFRGLAGGQRPSTTDHVQQCAETFLGVTASSAPHSDCSTQRFQTQSSPGGSPWLLLLVFLQEDSSRIWEEGLFFWGGKAAHWGLYWDDWELSFLLSWLEGALPFQGEWAPSAGELLKLSSSSSPFAPSNCVFSSRVIRRSSSSPNSPPIRVGSPTIITS